MQSHWEHFEHGADIGVRGFGPTKEAAFEQAALAMTGVVTDPAEVRAVETVRFECEARDDALLLARWLNAVASEMDVRHMLFSRFHVQIRDHRLTGQAEGEPVSVPRHAPAVEVKGATCTELRVAPAGDDGWVAQTVVDV
jgi:tRNA nucleotidyltransferase (CCA-adding enzyme)